MRSFINPNTNSTVFGQGLGLDMGIDRISTGLSAQTLYLYLGCAGQLIVETAQRIARCVKSAVAEAVQGMHSMFWMLTGPEPSRQPAQRASHTFS